MPAFVSNPLSLPLQSRSLTALCPRRPLPTRHRAHIKVSAVTDEVRPVDNPQPANDLTPPIHTPRPKLDSSSRDERTGRPKRFNRKDDRRDRSSAPPPFVPDPTATYYTKCANCQAAYELDPLELGSGKKVACSVCANEWFQKPERMLVLDKEEGFKSYPVEKKDELIEQSRSERRDRQQSSRRDNRDRRTSRQRSQFSVFVGNLPFSVTESDIEQLFKSSVNALRVSVVRDPAGKSKGFAFADVSSEEEVQTAVEQLNGVEIGGRAIVVRAGRKRT